MSKNLSELAGKKGINTNLFEELGIASQETGTPSSEKLQELADKFLVGLSSAYGTTTFYDFMKPENKNKKAYVCNGTACVCSGKQEAVTTALKNHLKEEEIGHMTCLGRCHENGAFHYNG
ncbi:MAG: NADH:ubiquinone oxidoreductase subunit E, partial [Arenicella sp.]